MVRMFALLRQFDARTESSSSSTLRKRFSFRSVRGRVSSEPRNFVAWIYADPVGPEHNTLNCSISDLELDVELDGGSAETLRVSGAAAYEFGTRDTDHGIPVQPYPDG